MAVNGPEELSAAGEAARGTVTKFLEFVSLDPKFSPKWRTTVITNGLAFEGKRDPNAFDPQLMVEKVLSGGLIGLKAHFLTFMLNEGHYGSIEGIEHEGDFFSGYVEEGDIRAFLEYDADKPQTVPTE